MDDGEGQKGFDREVELESEELGDEDVDAEMEDVLVDTVPPGKLPAAQHINLVTSAAVSRTA